MNGKGMTDMSLFDKYALKEDLKNGIHTVVFEKTDGTIREMRCTLQSDMLPQFLSEVSDRVRHEPEGVIAVWDVDNQGWRSFRVDSVQTVLKE
jgi:hypothetical protein